MNKFTIEFADKQEIEFTAKDKVQATIQALHYAYINKMPLQLKTITDSNGFKHSIDVNINFTQIF